MKVAEVLREHSWGNMVTQLGGVLSAPDIESVGKKDVVNLNPDVIFVVYMSNDGDDPDSTQDKQVSVIADDPALAGVSALRSSCLYPVDLPNIYASGPRTADGLQVNANGLYAS